MAKSDQFEKGNISKGNSVDSLLVIYIFNILKKYSSPQNHLSSKDVMEYLKKDYSIDGSDKTEAHRKKVRRHLDTLYESYCNSCIGKTEGKTRSSHKWYYDVSRDTFANEGGMAQETLNEVEVNLLVDLISATKILSSEGTRGLADKLLKKTSISEEDRARRLEKIQKEAWLKTPNKDLVEKKDLIEDCFYTSNITFDYEDEESVTATPLDWNYDDGTCYLKAKVGDECRKFALDKIRISNADADGYEDTEDFMRYEKETDSDKTTVDSFLVNMPTIKNAIADKKCIRFLYCSYVVDNGKVISEYEEKCILPHSLVFNDGKYYLIGVDEKSPELNKIAYFRVDLMFELYCIEPEFEMSDWDKHIFETTERARVVEKHPLMLAGTEVPVTFKVVESALDRVVDTFAVRPDKFKVTEETRAVKDFFDEGFHEERVVSIEVRTTSEEAYRWALANADVTELVYPTDIRCRLRRIAPSVHKTYVKTMDDKVQANVDLILTQGDFKIDHDVDKYLAYESFKALKNNDAVDRINIHGVNADEISYAGSFVNSKWLHISKSQCTDPQWVSNLTELVNVRIRKTSIENVSWLYDMKKLKSVILEDSPISDLSSLREHQEIRLLELRNLNICDISFIENKPYLLKLSLVGCPVEDYSPLLRIPPLDYLMIDSKVVDALGMEALIEHHPSAVIRIDNREI